MHTALDDCVGIDSPRIMRRVSLEEMLIQELKSSSNKRELSVDEECIENEKCLIK